MVHETLGISARPGLLAGGRIPTIACGMVGTWPTGVKKWLTRRLDPARAAGAGERKPRGRAHGCPVNLSFTIGRYRFCCSKVHATLGIPAAASGAAAHGLSGSHGPAKDMSARRLMFG